MAQQWLIELSTQNPNLELLTDPSECLVYGYDNSCITHVPDAVALVKSHQEVESIVKTLNCFNVPIVPRGLGSGTPGGAVPTRGGVVVSFEKMNRIIEINPEDRFMLVEPGVTNEAVQLAAKEHGLFWAPDPTSQAFCTVGGNLAYNSAGPRAVKYGTCRENTLGLTCVTGAGTTLKTGVYTTKGVVGYDLTRLIIGSEGTLALITEARLKLLPLPQAKATIQLYYDSIDTATQAIANLMQQAHVPCALEFIDNNALEIIRKSDTNIQIPENAHSLLMVEVDGLSESLHAVADLTIASATTPGLLSHVTAFNPEETKRLWQARKALSPALKNIAPKKINEDVAVPVSKIPQLINYLNMLAKSHDISIVNFGHAGNGNIHVNLLINPDDPIQKERAQQCLDQIFQQVIELKGTISGEHGVGLAKKPYINREIDAAEIELMVRIKKQFDPNNILNPDKIFPDHDSRDHSTKD